MNVQKRNGKLEEFDVNKIINAINKCFVGVGNYKEMPSEVGVEAYCFAQAMSEKPDIKLTVEEIQDWVEKTLMEMSFYDEAKAFILYREKHRERRIHAAKTRKFVQNFINSNTAADATIDDNSNVGTKGVAVLNAEVHKEDNQGDNFELWGDKVSELYPELSIKQMLKDFDTVLYPHDSSSQILMPYCMAVSMYPFLLHGLAGIGGKSATPKSLESFCGIYINLVFALASEVKGAVATPEFLMYMDYFCRKEWGDNYYEKSDVIITNEHSLKQKTIGSQIDQYFQQVTYSINQVAGSRGAQSPFTNFSFFDEYFFKGMFGDFYFPDSTQPKWESTKWLQQRYLHWLNQERLKCVLTFPVCSYSLLTDEEGNFMDKDTADFVAQEYSEGDSFFTYISSSVDSLSSCCRLRSEVKDNTFSFTNGMIGVMTGSKNVITLNLNRITQDYFREVDTNYFGTSGITYKDITDEDMEGLKKYLINILDRVYKYHTAYNTLLHEAKDSHLFLAYDDGFINLDKQYLTVGVNGLNQAAEFLGLEVSNNEQYRNFCRLVFSTIKEQNTLHKTKHEMFNTELVPAESAAIKLYNRDKKDGYWVPEDTNLYASYIFKPNDSSISILDKITLHSEEFATDCIDGGVSAHLNLDSHLNKEQYNKILSFAAKKKCSYLTFNVPNSECDKCHFITKHPISKCPKCGSEHITYYDRVIGYLTPIKNWSAGRRVEQKTRVYEQV